jgi:hypothetical protein
MSEKPKLEKLMLLFLMSIVIFTALGLLLIKVYLPIPIFLFLFYLLIKTFIEFSDL